jgi:hypothetical protein
VCWFPIPPDWTTDPDDWATDASVDWDAALAVWAGEADQPPNAEREQVAGDLAGSAPGSVNDLVDAAIAGHGRRSGVPVPGIGGTTEWGGLLPPETVRRLACDSAINRIILGPDDVPISAGRRTRLGTAAMRRVLIARDGGCRFHGCDRPPAWTQLHHIVHWADGGPTDLDNLILLCGHHHHRLHDDGWTLELNGHALVIHRPDGTILDPP